MSELRTDWPLTGEDDPPQVSMVWFVSCFAASVSGATVMIYFTAAPGWMPEPATCPTCFEANRRGWVPGSETCGPVGDVRRGGQERLPVGRVFRLVRQLFDEG